MAAVLTVPTAEILGAVPLLFGGLFAGVLGTPLLARRISLPRVVALGAATQATGLTLAATASTPATFLQASALVGVGFGAVESGGAVLAQAAGPRRATGPLTGLMACVAAVAALTPVLIVALGAGGGTRASLVVLAAPHLGAALVLGWAADPEDGRARPSDPRDHPFGLRAIVWPASAIFFYVGTESMLAGWSAALVGRELSLPPRDAALGTSGFWVLLTVGRLAGWMLLRRGVAAHALMTGCLAAACATLTAATALLPTSPDGAVLATGLAVVACGPCYAQILGVGVRLVDDAAQSYASAGLVATGALGGALLTGLGVLAAASLEVGPTAVPAVAAVLATVAAHKSPR